ncbi:hypothetical protein FJQ98_01975 [Lysinibacillus agricola]|uniref:Uncharacterized protein n=1 Tax=Lysinibacillus agricola TaxID=2590012 RepID=A0ABX7ATB5_9BACI|nr:MULTISPECIES: hypothetical protein [Lysinibacillus]KOS61281.1 hypothetical protein AN161_18550 [Lysinibacillus sp. FJAT-14222]QQP12881.1 hypothetical protein FJQ98_01975 [Lysinibacillus agricola]
MTNIVLARDPGASIASKAAHRKPPGSFALCESEASATKRPVQSERKSTTRYDDDPKMNNIYKKQRTVLKVISTFSTVPQINIINL